MNMYVLTGLVVVAGLVLLLAALRTQRKWHLESDLDQQRVRQEQTRSRLERRVRAEQDFRAVAVIKEERKGNITSPLPAVDTSITERSQRRWSHS